jgi:aspartate-semialdehyde dehydrogenase
MKKFNIAVVGATGNVGREIIRILEERDFPVGELYAIASNRSKGKDIAFGNDKVIVEDIEKFDFSKADIGLFSPGSSVSKKYAPIAAKAGCVVIDNTSHFRMDKDVPLIVPEVNADEIKSYKKKNIIANPNCSTIQLVVALKPLHDAVKIKRVVVSTYQSVSGAGKSAMDELFRHTKSLLMNETKKSENFTKPIPFNVIPHIDVFMDDGYTKEEWKMMVETKKILDENIQLTANCVRVPVFVGHGEAVNIEFESEISEADVFRILKKAAGITVVDKREDGGYITPKEIVREDDVFISRIRKDPTVKHGIAMWVVADNLRKGAALNAVQIAEKLIHILQT